MKRLFPLNDSTLVDQRKRHQDEFSGKEDG
jgi:hypothetical protein